MKINEARLLLYKSIAEKGMHHKDTIKISKKLDKLILKDTIKYNRV